MKMAWKNILQKFLFATALYAGCGHITSTTNVLPADTHQKTDKNSATLSFDEKFFNEVADAFWKKEFRIDSSDDFKISILELKIRDEKYIFEDGCINNKNDCRNNDGKLDVCDKLKGGEFIWQYSGDSAEINCGEAYRKSKAIIRNIYSSVFKKLMETNKETLQIFPIGKKGKLIRMVSDNIVYFAFDYGNGQHGIFMRQEEDSYAGFINEKGQSPGIKKTAEDLLMYAQELKK